MAAGGFVGRAFESILKECASTKKYPGLQKAIQACLDGAKDVKQPSLGSERTQGAVVAGDGSSAAAESEDGVEKGGPEADGSISGSQGAEETQNVSKTADITTALASAGYTLNGAEVELVLNPLRLAFDTKNLKILESALDCLHKLIAYDHLEGDPGLDAGKNVPLFTDILNIVCSCIDNSSPDSTILQVLKVLLTAVASSKFRANLLWMTSFLCWQ